MTPVRYVPDLDYQQKLEQEEEYKAGRFHIAKEVARIVQLLAPVRNAKYKRKLPGVYKRRVKAELSGVRVRDPFWHFVEFGTVHTKPSAPLRRGFRAAGLRLVVFPKS